ncbi:MAG: hypothetical protein FJ008_00500 [Chloroflexi bacterium]|nr:hypothetical protein [Chloroflexota bacterium]MBM3173466.1 hypothetical protein [Chloroflexota bacterium]MBM3174627.1 hypothetical protein [Chloroflexota bacterium]MBM4449381.1 hypothetical protein [Chloroflexota bacterium]
MATFAVPEARYGVHYVQFAPVAGVDPVNFQFNVEPSLKVQPTSAQPGTVLIVNGTGFPSNDSGTLLLAGDATGTRVNTNEAGSFETRFTVPTAPPGEYKLFVDIPMVYAKSGIATIQILPAVKPAPSQETPSTPSSETKTSSEAGYTLVPVEDRHPPREPMPIAPMGHSFGLWGAKEVTFGWNSVTDSSGVTYTLEISQNVNFDQFGGGAQRAGLLETSYTAKIEPGTYYWRVKAVDGAGNESYWGYAHCAFTVGELSYLLRELGDALKSIFSPGI